MEINFKGLSFVVDHNDYQEFWDNFNNWENKDLDFVIEKAEKDKIFIDIGAWIGPYTLVAAKLGMRVFAFEPDKIAFEVLKKNIQLNEFKYKPEIYNFGLSKKETIAYLYSNTNEGNILTSNVLIIDNIGMLSNIYKYGDIAYIGGGFGAGIHNILEAVAFG